jgi:hypothetical protein
MRPNFFAIFTPPALDAGEGGSPTVYYCFSESNQDIARQTFVVGALFTLFTFADSFNARRPHSLTTTTTRIACREIDGIYFLLGCDLHSPEIVVEKSLNLLLDYFHFLFRSIADVKAAYPPESGAFAKVLNNIGSQLLSLLYICYPDPFTQTFHPLPYTPLPDVC